MRVSLSAVRAGGINALLEKLLFWHLWQYGEKRAAFVRRACDSDCTTLRFDDSFGQRQTETGTVKTLGFSVTQLLELNEQAAEVLLIDADAGISDLQTKCGRPFHREGDYDATARLGKLQRIGEIIEQHLLKL